MLRVLSIFLMLLAAPAFAQDAEELPDKFEFSQSPTNQQTEQGVDDEPSIQELFGLPQDETDDSFEAVIPGERVKMRGLNKVTADVTDFTAEFDQPIRFGSLTVIARYCSTRPPEFIPETFVFLEIFDRRLNGGEATQYGEKIFSGWMLGSSPGLHGLEHPVFDVWPVECVTAPPPESPEPAEEAE